MSDMAFQIRRILIGLMFDFFSDISRGQQLPLFVVKRFHEIA